MDGNIEKECSALGGLFQCIVNDLKSGYPIWEDFTQKATKLHFQLKSVVAAINAFLDAMQRVADLATNAKGATRDIGTALTRICMRHRSIENRLKTMASALIDCLVVPLQEKLEDWRRTVSTMDKEHSREYKRARADIKKRSLDSSRLQKKVRKGQKSMQRMLESAVQDINDRYYCLLETERQAVRQALTEQRSQFCVFVNWFKPVTDGELALLQEVGQLQEVVDLMNKHAADPYTLPPASEAVIADIKGLENTWRFQTPPSSPGSSLGSRKSSFCSLSSNDCVSQQPHNPSLTTQLRNQTNAPAVPRFSSMCSQDSGFTSQDALYGGMPGRSPPQLMSSSTQGGTSEEDDSTQESFNDSQQSTPSPSPSSATWPEGSTAGTAGVPPRIAQMSTPPPQRPHTISATYSAQGSKRPVLTNAIFVPPRPTTLFKVSLKQKRSSSQDPAAQRPPLPQQKPNGMKPGKGTPLQTPTGAVSDTAAIPDFNRVQPDQFIPQPIYANLHELKRAGAETPDNSCQPAGRYKTRRPLSFAGTDQMAALLNMAIDGVSIRDDDEDTLIGECMEQIDQLASDLNRYCSNSCDALQRPASSSSPSTNTNASSAAADEAVQSVQSYCTLPRRGPGGGAILSPLVEGETTSWSPGRVHPPQLTSLNSVLKGGLATPVAPTITDSNQSTIVRRQSMAGRAPPPPVRRNSAITAATPTAPAVDIMRSNSRCTSPAGTDDTYMNIGGLSRCYQSMAMTASAIPNQNYVMQQQQHEYLQMRQLRAGCRANSEPPIQENAGFARSCAAVGSGVPEMAPGTGFDYGRETLLTEIRNGVPLRPVADSSFARR